MSFTLDLSTSSIASPVRLDLAVIEAAMLWPDDATHRSDFCRAAAIQDGREWALRVKDGAILAEIMQNHDRLPDLASLQPGARWHVHGIIAGKRVVDAVMSAHHSERALRLAEIDDNIHKDLMQPFEERRNTFPIRPQTLKNKNGPIHRYRPVAHLWAAHHVAVHEGREGFPCVVDDLPRFLATAEIIRALAETTCLPNSHHKIMRPGEAVTLPVEVISLLPKVGFVGR